MALAKKNRLHSALFSRIFSSKIRRHSTYFQVIKKTSSKKRFAVVVGKKVSKSAVERNRLRRQLYEIIRTKLFSQIPTGSYIVLTKPAMKDADMKELAHDLLSLFGKFE